jgi:hypothetical protein
MDRWCWKNSVAAAGPATGLFPPQARDWGLPLEMSLSPRAAARVAREAAVQRFDPAARALNEDWGTHYDGKQVQRWAEALGRGLVQERQAELEAYERGQRPRGPLNDPELLVIGLDGGRVQGQEVNPETGSRWKENKVATITTCRPGDGQAKPPRPLVTTYLATMQDCVAFGKLARLEAERRGIRQARHVLVLGDGGNWIDPLHAEYFGRHQRILDYYHAAEHLHEVAKALYPQDESRRRKIAERLITLLWRGQTTGLLRILQACARRLGPPTEADGPQHPRRVVAQNLGYFQKHQMHMNYPAYRARGWPIGSGITEAGVKQFNQRVKGTDQFWSEAGVEAILALRALWLSQDQRWDHYWLGPRPLPQAA